MERKLEQVAVGDVCAEIVVSLMPMIMGPAQRWGECNTPTVEFSSFCSCLTSQDLGEVAIKSRTVLLIRRREWLLLAKPLHHFVQAFLIVRLLHDRPPSHTRVYLRV